LKRSRYQYLRNAGFVKRILLWNGQDDSHKKTIDEDKKIYVYDKEGDRIEVKSWETQD
jgi:hypothetical protein